MSTGTNKVLREVPGRVWRSKASGMAPTQRETLRRQLATAAGKKDSVSFSLFLELNNLGIEHELACAAACMWAQKSLDGSMEGRYVGHTWNRQVWEATSWTKVGGLAGAVFGAMKDLGFTVLGWQVLKMGGGKTISVKDTSPEDNRELRWRKYSNIKLTFLTVVVARFLTQWGIPRSGV